MTPRPDAAQDGDLRDECAAALGRMRSLGAQIHLVLVQTSEWWRLAVPEASFKACRLELAMLAFFVGRGCGIHAKPTRAEWQGQRCRFGSRRLNGAFCQAVRETNR